MTTEKFQLLNMVEVTLGEDCRFESVEGVHTSVRVLDAKGKARDDVPEMLLLLAAVDVVASVYNRSDDMEDQDKFVEMVEELLRASLNEITTTGLQ